MKYFKRMLKESSGRCTIEIRFLSKSTLSRAGKTINCLLKGPPAYAPTRCNIIYRLLSKSYFFHHSYRYYQPPSFFPTAQAWNMKSSIFLHITQPYSNRKFSPFPLPAHAICWSYCSSRWRTCAMLPSFI